jgi:hypothetical protein
MMTVMTKDATVAVLTVEAGSYMWLDDSSSYFNLYLLFI